MTIVQFSQPKSVATIDLGYWCDSCPHVYEGGEAHGSYYEDDSFGPVVRSMMCKECTLEALRPENLLRCERCGAQDNSVGTRKSHDSADWYCLCRGCCNQNLPSHVGEESSTFDAYSRDME